MAFLKREVPQNFPNDVVKVLDAMNMGGKMILVGSASLRSQQYWADYDLVEEVKISNLSDACSRVKECIRRLRGIGNAFFGDIKIGIVPDWMILPEEPLFVDGKVKGYSSVDVRRKLNTLRRDKVISPAEEKKGLALAVENPSVADLLEMREEFKYHILRWLPSEVLAGQTVCRGKTITLEQAIASPGKTKIDVIAWVMGNRFSDFSCIYQFVMGKKVVNPFTLDVRNGLLENAAFYKAKGEPFKALKRVFAYLVFTKQEDKAEKLLPVLNGDLGRIYAMYSDLGTLEYMLEEGMRAEKKDIDFELEQFKIRFGTIWNTPDFLHIENSLLGKVESAIKSPNRKMLLERIREISDALKKVLASDTPSFDLSAL
jgi:hypothetical protein